MGDDMDINSSDDLPLKALVWPGSLLASIAHAIFVARAPFMAHEQSWDGQNYNLQNSEGSRGTIAFGEDKTNFVAVFYVQTSGRNPLKQPSRDRDEASAFLRNIPDQLEPLSREALQYVLQEVDGRIMPVITAAFWSDLSGSRVTAGEPWPDVVRHGAALIKNQLLPAEIAIERWAAEFEFTPTQTALTEALFKRRLAAMEGAVQLTLPEAQYVREMACSDAGLQACKQSLGEVGIVFR